MELGSQAGWVWGGRVWTIGAARGIARRGGEGWPCCRIVWDVWNGVAGGGGDGVVRDGGWVRGAWGHRFGEGPIEWGVADCGRGFDGRWWHKLNFLGVQRWGSIVSMVVGWLSLWGVGVVGGEEGACSRGGCAAVACGVERRLF